METEQFHDQWPHSHTQLNFYDGPVPHQLEEGLFGDASGVNADTIGSHFDVYSVDRSQQSVTHFWSPDTDGQQLSISMPPAVARYVQEPQSYEMLAIGHGKHSPPAKQTNEREAPRADMPNRAGSDAGSRTGKGGKGAEYQNEGCQRKHGHTG
ncbi:hypothetical protein BKA67DRAFT_548822 [Truncatella angustata]|uniref:Uncharacterized protein n=1 Tax=Truncatella angustata TaxID=152316 RepID=A0A9P8UYH1_9PEZI|nr:uncharacterized protein BKA67DRAFT_548822 [Truncatella angustata]KAH6660672.1 hypothetical protein BKA67DRAFT_548822 [Truncatella angustata]